MTDFFLMHIETSTFSQRVLFYFADRQTTFYESLFNLSIMDHTKVLNFSIDKIWKVQQYPNCNLVWSNFCNSISCFSMVSSPPVYHKYPQNIFSGNKENWCFVRGSLSNIPLGPSKGFTGWKRNGGRFEIKHDSQDEIER